MSEFNDLSKLAVIRGDSDIKELAKKLLSSESERKRALKELKMLKHAQESIRKLVLENAGSFPVKAHSYIASIYTEEMANVVRRHVRERESRGERRPIPIEKMGMIDGEELCPWVFMGCVGDCFSD